MRLSTVAIALCLTGSVACGSSAGNGDDDDDDVAVDAPSLDPADAGAEADAPTAGLPEFERCVGRPFTPAPDGEFAGLGGTLAAVAGAPLHSAEDTIAPPGSAPHLVARFGYGTLNSALPNEPVEVSIDDCGGWRSLGQHTTDGNGLLDVEVNLPLGPGVYEARFQVVGDATLTAGFLWLLPAGTHLAISDIDGTLTTSDLELFLQLINNGHVPAAYESATELTHTHADKGHIVVYVTGRPFWLTAPTRQWLSDLQFAAGPLRLAPSNGDILPTDASVGTYKKTWLEGLIAKGYVLDLAYGNATTDIFAYTEAGIPATQQWIIGSHAGEGGTNAVMDSWSARVSEVEQLPAVVQPFRL